MMKKGTVEKAIGHNINVTVYTSLIDHGVHENLVLFILK